MHIVAIVQARTGSTRLPNKVLTDIAGQPMIAHVLDRAAAIPGVEQVLVATTTHPSDRALLDLAATLGFSAYAGSEADVLDRYYRTAQQAHADAVVRITADCPLLDPEVSGRIVRRFLRGDVEYASNTQPPTFPDGLDTEAFSFAALERAWREATQLSEREHVTPYLWKNPSKFRLANVTATPDLSAHRWTVDDAADVEFVRSVYAHLRTPEQPLFGMADVLALLEREPELRSLNAEAERNEGYARSVRLDSAPVKHVGDRA